MASKDGVSYPSGGLWYHPFQYFIRHAVLPRLTKKNNVHAEVYHRDKKAPMLVLHNHVTDLDFFVYLNGYPYYARFILSDAMVRTTKMRIITKIFADFIFRRKGDNADAVVKSIEATIAKGQSVIMAPEGEESPNGNTAPIRKRTGQMIKDLNVDILTYRLEGGYFKMPAWADNASDGPMFGKVVKVHTKEELSELSPEEINDLLYEDLHINHYDWIKEKRIPYDRVDRAQCMERELFMCPNCGSMCTLHSHKDTLSCSECGYSVDVDEYGLFVGEKVYFDNLYDWDIWQTGRISELAESWVKDPDHVITSDDHLRLSKIEGKEKVLLEEDVRAEMTSNTLRIYGGNTDMIMPLRDIKGIALTNRDTFSVNYGGIYYLLRSPVPTSVRRYRTFRKLLIER